MNAVVALPPQESNGTDTVDRFRDRGITFVDAIVVDLFTPPVEPVSGDHVALSGQANCSYKRITRTIAVPAPGGELTFHVDRETHPSVAQGQSSAAAQTATEL